MIIGDRFTGIEVPLDWVERFDAVCVSVEYRLAPEFPDPYLVEDCYAGLGRGPPITPRSSGSTRAG